MSKIKALNAAKKAWEERNAIESQRKIRDKRTNKRKWVREYKSQNSVCVDCNISYPPHMLDFDHLDNKTFNLSGDGVKDNDIEAIMEEIKKCEIVCSNCHRHRTYMRSADKPKK